MNMQRFHGFLFFILLAVGVLPMRAQSPLRWGGMGFASPGLTFPTITNIDGLITELGFTSGSTPGAAWELGGGGFGLLGERVVVGGHGYSFFYADMVETDREISMDGGGGAFRLGYAVLNDGQQLLYPYAGIGGMQVEMEVDNRSGGELRLGDRSLPNNSMTTLELPQAQLELGLGWQRLLALGGPEGFAIGIDLHYSFSLSEQPWQDASDVAWGGLAGQASRWSLTITVGGGGFME